MGVPSCRDKAANHALLDTAPRPFQHNMCWTKFSINLEPRRNDVPQCVALINDVFAGGRERAYVLTSGSNDDFSSGYTVGMLML